MSEHDPLRTLLLELALAVGMIACLVGAMFIHTGSMPPLVVVESKSMIHDEGGELGSIDAGDLILVHDQPGDTIVTYAEATDPSNPLMGMHNTDWRGTSSSTQRTVKMVRPSFIAPSCAWSLKKRSCRTEKQFHHVQKKRPMMQNASPRTVCLAPVFSRGLSLNLGQQREQHHRAF